MDEENLVHLSAHRFGVLNISYLTAFISLWYGMETVQVTPLRRTLSSSP